MPFAVTHILSSIFCVDLYRKFVAKHKKYFTLHTLFVAGLAGLLPDIDIPLDLITDPFGYDIAHGGLTHTPFFAIIFLLPGIFFWMKKRHVLGMYFFVSTFAMLLHILLDHIFSPYVESGLVLFYPFSGYAVYIGTLGNFTTVDTMELYAAIDAVLLLTWLGLVTYRHKIRDYF